MKLQQGQIWKLDEHYVRITRLERLAVGYKKLPTPESKEGTHHHATKKEFCRLLKTATLLPPTPTPAQPKAVDANGE